MTHSIDHAKVENLVRELLESLRGPAVDWSEDWLETPGRVARHLVERFNPGPRPEMKLFGSRLTDMVTVVGTPFESLCPHHLLPYYGHVNVAYIPTGRVVGLSKIPRLIRWCSASPLMQEELTKKIATELHGIPGLGPQGVLVTVSARHTCMEFRGVRSPGQKTLTTAVMGSIDKAEVLSSFSLSRE